MCRHLAWLGAPRSLGELLLEPEHGLLRQSYAPRRQRHGTMNADGWGAGFYAGGRAEPARWRSNRPLWSDASFASVAPVILAGCVLAAVRSATVGMPGDETAAAPFGSGRDPGARLNLLLTDGQRILATRWKDTLSVLRTEHGVAVASEPYDDDPRWADVPDFHLVDVTADAVIMTGLEN
ncbi:MAG TPA: class II glutamine amidotransferase [Streptosporangiaceae bacterium]|nr:class II glutamine amidotransferase [Streptosporangiaceae bacterium]